jgi:hypothetical protein
MKKVMKPLVLVALCQCLAGAQQFEYVPVVVDDQGNCRVERINVETGVVQTFLDSVGEVGQLMMSQNGSLLFLQSRSVLEVRSIDSPTVAHRLLDDVDWVHEILDVPTRSKVFVSVGTVDSCEETIIFDRVLWVPLDTITGFWSYEIPLLSADGGTIYRLLPDEARITFQAFDGSSGRKTVIRPVAGVGGFAYKPS